MGIDSTLSGHPDTHDHPSSSRALQISNAVGRVHKEFVGRGPTTVRTHIVEDVVVCVLEGGLTRAEQTAWEHEGHAAVRQMRIRLQEAMRPSIVEAIEAIVGRRVKSFMSSNDPELNLQAEVILLD
jgi:uncharacterized protein YbcI